MTEQEMMDNWMRNATPGAEHALLAKYVGEFNVKMIDNGKEMEGKAKNEMILGGRVQIQHFNMIYNGMPFEGHGMTGFDNYTKRYWFTWNDNMSTGLYSMWGTASADGKSVVFEGAMDRPGMDIKAMPVRHAYRFLNDDEFTYEAWDYPGQPNEKKSMEMHYKRV